MIYFIADEGNLVKLTVPNEIFSRCLKNISPPFLFDHLRQYRVLEFRENLTLVQFDMFPGSEFSSVHASRFALINPILIQNWPDDDMMLCGPTVQLAYLKNDFPAQSSEPAKIELNDKNNTSYFFEGPRIQTQIEPELVRPSVIPTHNNTKFEFIL
ncbi:MAG: hypothetical protein Q7R33_04930 [Nitrosarchaeum sp.]|nr:hypothetical protein [Nitrosarchaeum sp.]